MLRLIWVFAGRTCHFVGFVVKRLIKYANLIRLSLSNLKDLPRNALCLSYIHLEYILVLFQQRNMWPCKFVLRQWDHSWNYMYVWRIFSYWVWTSHFLTDALCDLTMSIGRFSRWCRFCCLELYTIEETDCLFSDPLQLMSHVTRKPVFGVCDQVRLKPTCSAIETLEDWNFGYSK